MFKSRHTSITLRKNEVWAWWPDPQSCMEYFSFRIQWRIRIYTEQTCKCTVFQVISLFQFFIYKKLLKVVWFWLEKSRKQNKTKLWQMLSTRLLPRLFLFWPPVKRPFNYQIKICPHFEAATFKRPRPMYLNWEKNLEQKIFHQPWGVWSSRASLIFSKSEVAGIVYTFAYVSTA